MDTHIHTHSKKYKEDILWLLRSYTCMLVEGQNKEQTNPHLCFITLYIFGSDLQRLEMHLLYFLVQQ
jgi:hypothetical protein